MIDLQKFFFRDRREDRGPTDAPALLRSSVLMDAIWYKEFYADLRGSALDAVSHYLEYGMPEGRNPNPFFDTAWYLRSNPDVAAAGINPLVHYLQQGAAEGRDPHPLFDTDWYLAKNPDVVAAGINPLAHFICFGASEGRDPHPLFDTTRYVEQVPEAEGQALAYYLENGPTQHRANPHPLFDTEFYLSEAPGFGGTIAPLVHYLREGREKGRPNEVFDNQWYLNHYPDVRAAKAQPLVHYLLQGAEEGRDPSPDFSTRWYLSENPDIAEAQINPLIHYLLYGRREDRKPAPINSTNGYDARAIHVSNLKTRFSAFLASSKRFKFAYSEKPLLSIVLVLFNKAHFTFGCLESLYLCLAESAFPYEIVILDNGSTDLTHELLKRCDNLRVRLSEKNLGFLQGVNLASDLTRGEFLLLLNNDTQVPFGTLENALKIISGSRDVGAVGARLILPSWTLQEAGSIIWNDGSCLGYCRGRDPDSFEANFRRDVDYCSGAFLLTRMDVFKEFGGFNPIYAPAYYEETDYCLRLWESGRRVVYDPSVVIFHFEFASASARTAATAQQADNQKKFKAIHAATLENHFTPSQENILFAREAGPRGFHLLFVDDRVPHAYLGSGFPRARAIIERFAALGAKITLCPTDDQIQSWDRVRETLNPTIEVAFGTTPDRLVKFIRDRGGYYDAIFVSRPHNLLRINDALESEPQLLGGAQLVYDAEALFTDRDVALRRLRGETVTEEERQRLLDEEIKIARFASTILCVSAHERVHFAKWPDKRVHVLSHTLEIKPTETPLEERKNILFVGAIHADDSPNADSLIWFIDEILPLLRKEIKEPFKFIIAGLNKSDAVKERLNDDIVATGPVPDLTPLYAESRIFVAPTRFAAGIPHKVHEAAARGLPCVVTPLLAEQLGWVAKQEALVGADAEAFAEACARLYKNRDLWTSVRDNALKAIERDCDPRAFETTLNSLYASLTKTHL